MNRVFKVRALEKATITRECADDLAETPSPNPIENKRRLPQ